MSRFVPPSSRPRILRLIGIFAVSALLVAACSSDGDTSDATPNSEEAATAVALPPGASLTSTEVGDVTVHAYVGITGINGTYVVESANALVVIDSQFQDPDPATLRAIADSLDKPIDHLLITHNHPDHTGGIESAFADVKVGATQNVAESIGGADTILDSTFTIDGVEWSATEYFDAEAEVQMVLAIDGAVFTGDLVYNDVHLFLSPQLEGWIDVLGELEATYEGDIVFPGHGSPGDAESFGENVEYLQTVIDLLPTVSTVDEYKAAVLAAYPDLPGQFFIDFYAEGLLAARGSEGG